MIEKESKALLSDNRKSKISFIAEDFSKSNFKIYIKDYYISSVNLILSRNGIVRDIFSELKKYDPAFNPSHFVAKEPVFGLSIVGDDMRALNLEMPLSYLKSNSVHLFRKIYSDQ
jgi:hypothetical protein